MEGANSLQVSEFEKKSQKKAAYSASSRTAKAYACDISLNMTL